MMQVTQRLGHRCVEAAAGVSKKEYEYCVDGTSIGAISWCFQHATNFELVNPPHKIIHGHEYVQVASHETKSISM